MLNPPLKQWLSSLTFLGSYTASPITGDASFRQYYRIQSSNQSYILMDASLEKKSCQPFFWIAEELRKKNLHTPEIFANDFSNGYLLLTDFGERLFLREINVNNSHLLYQRALETLQILIQCKDIPNYTLPIFDMNFILQELQLFKEWFLEKFLKLIFTHQEQKILLELFIALAKEAMLQPQVFMHRDFHSANLMVLDNDDIGILDFQDAFRGPLTYDLVSLLRDCYITHPDEVVRELLLDYRKKIPYQINSKTFMRWFDWMGLQRHMKALLTFSRKFLRDQNRNYLQHIPRTLNYIHSVSSCYPELKAFHELLSKTIYPAFQKNEEKLCVE